MASAEQFLVMGAFAGAFVLYCYTSYKPYMQVDAAAKKYEFNDHQKSMGRSCVEDMKKHKLKFKSDAGMGTICGCAVEFVSSRAELTDETDYALAAESLERNISSAYWEFNSPDLPDWSALSPQVNKRSKPKPQSRAEVISTAVRDSFPYCVRGGV